MPFFYHLRADCGYRPRLDEQNRMLLCALPLRRVESASIRKMRASGNCSCKLSSTLACRVLVLADRHCRGKLDKRVGRVTQAAMVAAQAVL